MTVLSIDGRRVEVPPGATIRDAAERLGIEIPTLCHLRGYEPATSCLVCVVRVRGMRNGFVPACATRAVEGMEVASDTPEVRDARRTALELLLSEHVGDCLAPCHFACPAHMDVPLMLRQIGAGDLREAIVTIKRRIALPAVLGRVCPKPCEKGCRRAGADGPVAVCQLKRYAADADLASDEPYLPPCAPDTGRRVAIVGAGPTGLSAAYYLRQLGVAVTLFERQAEPGGRLLIETTPDELSRDVLRGEIETILRLGIELRLGTDVGQRPALAELRREYDAVLVACGTLEMPQAQRLGVTLATSGGISVDKDTFQTAEPGVFAAGNAIRAKGLVVRSVADGYEAAVAIHGYLAAATGEPAEVGSLKKPFSVRMGRLSPAEMEQLVSAAGHAQRAEPTGGYSPAEAAAQAGRCLHCDCRTLDTCRLRRYAQQYGADASRYRAERKPFEQISQHGEVIFEPGKCIRCGLCIQIAEAAGEPLGLAFVGRGFEVRVAVPFDRSLDEALRKVAAEVVAACPTAALAFRSQERGGLPILGQ